MALSDYLKAVTPLELERLRGRPSLEAKLPAIEDVIRRPVAVLEQVGEQLAAFAADPEQSPIGVERKGAEASQKAREVLDSLEAQHVAPLKAQVIKHRAKLLAAAEPTDPTDRLRLELQRQEVRRGLPLSDPQLMAVIVETTSDPAVLDAIATAPAALVQQTPEAMPVYRPAADPEAVARRRLALAQAANPAAFAELADLELVANLFTSTFAAARKALLSVAGRTTASGAPK